ncbi:MAG: hypothetical protein AAGI71_13540 [Bacteroidota bacterium]
MLFPSTHPAPQRDSLVEIHLAFSGGYDYAYDIQVKRGQGLVTSGGTYVSQPPRYEELAEAWWNEIETLVDDLPPAVRPEHGRQAPFTSTLLVTHTQRGEQQPDRQLAWQWFGVLPEAPGALRTLVQRLRAL